MNEPKCCKTYEQASNCKNPDCELRKELFSKIFNKFKEFQIAEKEAKKQDG